MNNIIVMRKDRMRKDRMRNVAKAYIKLWKEVEEKTGLKILNLKY